MKSRLLTSAVISASQVSHFLPLQILSIKKAYFASKTPKNFSVDVKPSARYLKSITKSALTKKLVDALEAYKLIHGNIDVKASFIVPTGNDGAEIDSRWPENIRGFRLGTRIVELRAEHRNANLRPTKGDSKALDDLLGKLENLGFIFCRREQQIKLLRLALTSYKSIYNDLNIPKFFVCPTDDPNWPEDTWGMKLGFTVGNIRNKGNFPELEDELLAMGINYSPLVDRRAGDLVVKAVDTFYKLYGNYKIPLEFQVPTNSESPFKKRSEMVPKVSSSSSDETLPYRWPYKPVEPIPYDFWPPEVRGMKLGFKFSNIYYSRSSVQLRNVLEAKGAFTDMEAPPYLWERSDSYGEVLQALKEFKMNFGHLNVPESFVVPADGQYLHPRQRQSILTRGDYTTDQDTENLRDNGLNENTDAINDDEKSRVFVDYTRAYVPSEEYLAMTWSKKSQRIKLGLKVRDLRFKAKYLAKNRAELDAIGFNWKYVDPEEEDSID